MTAYYNEIEPFAADWLQNLIWCGLIPDGEVDRRSIVDVQPSDLVGFTQCHFFAGIGGWAYAARLAGWPDDRELWTGSCPCQPFSVAGRGTGQADKRHLWPEYFRLIEARRPAVVMGEQVAAAIGKDWLDGVHLDLEGIGYELGATVVPACAVDAPHRRNRLWFVADSYGRSSGRIGGGFPASEGSAYEESDTLGSRHPRKLSNGPYPMGDADRARSQVGSSEPIDTRQKQPTAVRTNWHGSAWLAGADGKTRRVKPGVRLLAHGVPGRVGILRALGNAIVPQVAAEVIGAYMEASA